MTKFEISICFLCFFLLLGVVGALEVAQDVQRGLMAIFWIIFVSAVLVVIPRTIMAISKRNKTTARHRAVHFISNVHKKHPIIQSNLQSADNFRNRDKRA